MNKYFVYEGDTLRAAQSTKEGAEHYMKPGREMLTAPKKVKGLEVDYIKEGRFDNVIWIENLTPKIEYPTYFALDIMPALELWMGLSKALKAAGQLGTISAGMQELIK
jgi:hypothetical protein